MVGVQRTIRRALLIATAVSLLLPGLMWRPLQAESMTLNLRDADIASVIGTVSEMTGRNFIVDPRVKGRVTVVSNRPMDEDELYQVFLSILNVHGFSAVPTVNAIKIVPAVTAKQDALPLDGGDGDESVTRLMQVENIEAAQLVPVMRPLLPQEAHLAAYTPTNVLIISSTAANVDKVVAMVHQIDQAKDADIELVPLQHASAVELERILGALQQAQSGKRANAASDVQITADARTNSLILSGEKAARQNIKRVISQLDVPTDSGGNTRVIYLHYAKAADLAEVLSGIGQSLVAGSKGNAQGSAPSSSNFTIKADESSNSLVISAPPEMMRDLEAVVSKLDVRRAQVMVKAAIAELSTDSIRELGVQWGYDGSSQNEPVGLIDFNNTVGGIATAIQSGSAPPPLDGMTLGLGRTLNSGVKFGALIRALGGDANNNILSTPTLVTLDNEEAEITVGQNVPFITGSYTSTGNGSTPTNPFQTIQREDVGLTLKIKPQVNEGNAVRMEVTQEVSSISSSSSGASDLVTNKRSLKTTVMVDDGQVLVLGGLLDDQLKESEQKVPLLGDIPVLGWLFRYQSTQKVKRDLMVFLHPRILRDAKQGSALSSSKYSYIRARQLSMREDGVSLMSEEASPLLEEMEDFLELPPPYEGRNSPPGGLAEPPVADVAIPATLAD